MLQNLVINDTEKYLLLLYIFSLEIINLDKFGWEENYLFYFFKKKW